MLAAHDEVARSAFPRLVLEMTLTRVARKKPILSVEEVVEKLRAMEERLLQEKMPASPPLLRTALPEPASQQIDQEPGEEDKEEMEEARGKEDSLTAAKTAEKLPGGLSQEADGEWKEFVNFAKKRKPPFASLLEHGNPLALDERILEIGYPGKSFYLERMQEADNLAFLQDLTNEFFKRIMMVKVSGMNPASSSRNKGEENKGEGKNSPRDKQEDALNHPLVREAINIFGGRVVEIKLL